MTRQTPKPLLDVAGRPFLGWLIGELRRYGLSDIVLLAGFRGDRIIEALGDNRDIRVLVEPEPLGTGGALRFAADILDDRFFLLNGDSLFDINLWDLAGVARQAEATLAVRPLTDVSRYGAVVMEGDRIVRFDERSENPGPGLINGGVGVFAKRIIERIAPGGPVSIERDIYPRIAVDGGLFGRSYDAPFIDIGVPDDLERAERFIPRRLTRGAVIFDRDGVLNVDIDYAHRPDQIIWIDGAMEAIKAVNDAGLFAFVVTNQAGVAHGYYSEADVLSLHDWMNNELNRHGAHIDAFEYCPFHPEGTVQAYRRASNSRKPAPGMLLDLFQRFRVDRQRSVLIGDRVTDIEAAAAAGVTGVIYNGGSLLDVVGPIIPTLSR
jgi:D-glycero-D-manno-heptose 1,7-bisphosphate phosphatase